MVGCISLDNTEPKPDIMSFAYARARRARHTAPSVRFEFNGCQLDGYTPDSKFRDYVLSIADGNKVRFIYGTRLPAIHFIRYAVIYYDS